ncbi:MAG: DUF294 nucleotidyltransferase-like domain-containing protein [Caldilineaceae bacterium]
MAPGDFLRHYPPFDQLTAQEEQLVQAAVEIVRYARGASILHKGGAPSTHLYVVQSGAISFVDGGQVSQVLEEGEAFGYPSLLSGSPPVFDVVAASDVVLYRLPESAFRRLLDNVAVAEYFLKSLVARLRRTAAEAAPPPERSLATPLKYIMTRSPTFIEPDASVQTAAQLMHANQISSVLVRSDPPAILTDRDLRGRVLAAGLGPETPVRQVMTQPVKHLDSDTPVYAALLYMLTENIHHLVLVEEGEVVGVVSHTDLLRHQTHSPLYLQQQVAQTPAPATLARYADNITATVESLFQGGLGAAHIGQIISSLNDTLIRQLAKAAEASLGPPPTPYAWLVFGSEGRSEQLLLTDQDNALVYGEESPAAQAYFAALAQQVVEGLVAAGFPPCPGGYMATNWHRPLAEWEAIFAGWMRTPEPQALMEASIFFDFRVVHGDLSLEPLEQLLAESHQEAIFIGHLVRAAQEFAPPLGFFGRIRSEDGAVDLKKGGIAPIVGLARACALAAGSRERSTLERLVIAAEFGTISKEGAEILSETFQFLMNMRLRQQLAALRAHRPPTNLVQIDALSPVERRHLKEAFSSIRQLQDGIGATFRTGMLAGD